MTEEPIIIEKGDLRIVSDGAIESLLLAGVTPSGLSLAKGLIKEAYVLGKLNQIREQLERMKK